MSVMHVPFICVVEHNLNGLSITIQRHLEITSSPSIGRFFLQILHLTLHFNGTFLVLNETKEKEEYEAGAMGGEEAKGRDK